MNKPGYESLELLGEGYAELAHAEASAVRSLGRTLRKLVEGALDALSRVPPLP
jgi:hypothetical protein